MMGPPVDAEVLAFEVSPQSNDSWNEWLAFWWAEMQTATTLGEVSNVKRLAINDLIAQGASDMGGLVVNQPGITRGFAWGPLGAMANVQAANLGVWTPPAGTPPPPPGGYTFEPTIIPDFAKLLEEWRELEVALFKSRHGFEATPTAEIESRIATIRGQLDAFWEPGSYGPPQTQETLDRLYQILLGIESALPQLEAAAAAGAYPGAVQTFQVYARDALNIRLTLGLDREVYAEEIPPYEHPNPAPPGVERYIIDGIVYEFPQGHGPPTAEEIAAGVGVVDDITTGLPPRDPQARPAIPRGALIGAGLLALWVAFR